MELPRTQYFRLGCSMGLYWASGKANGHYYIRRALRLGYRVVILGLGFRG